MQISVSECVVLSGDCSGERQKDSPVKSDLDYLEDNSSTDKEASFLYIFHLYHAINRTKSTDTALSLETSNFSLRQLSLLGALRNQQYSFRKLGGLSIIFLFPLLRTQF